MIRVLIVEDSAVLRQSTRLMLASDPEIQIVGEANNGADAIAMVTQFNPAVVTMDIRMPKMDGFEAIRRIMSEHPVPIVVVASIELKQEKEIADQVTKLGAVSIVKRPTSAGSLEFNQFAAKLIEQVKLMSSIKVIRRGHSADKPTTPAFSGANPGTAGADEIELAAIGSSTGGPAALYQILGALPANFPVPIVIVQHISFGFVEGLAGWLNSACALNVQVGKLGDRLEPGQVYIASDDYHMVVERSRRINLKQTDPEGSFRPSINVLFESVAAAYGPAALGVILTGMGADGANGLKSMHTAGAMTLAQDEASCVVFGMPKEAIARGAARQIVSLNDMAQRMVNECVRSKRMAIA